MESKEIINTLSYLSNNHLTEALSSKDLQEKEKNLEIAYDTITLANKLDYFPKNHLEKQIKWFGTLILNSNLDTSRLKWMKCNQKH